MKNIKIIKNILWATLILALLGFLVYSFNVYKKSGIEENGVVTCLGEQCFWSAHIHLDMPMNICGVEQSLTKFKGALTKMHSHSDETVVHWHDKIIFDPKESKFLEPSPFKISTIFANLEIPIGNNTLLNKKNGDLCNGKPSSWKVFINGTHTTNWQDYEWKDGDIIFFLFDSRTEEEVEEDLKVNPLEFSPVGEG